MALVSCRDCGKEMSDTAVQCPHCGRPGTRPEFEIPPPTGKQSDVRKADMRVDYKFGPRKHGYLTWILSGLVLAGLLALMFVPGLAEGLRDRFFTMLGLD